MPLLARITPLFHPLLPALVAGLLLGSAHAASPWKTVPLGGGGYVTGIISDTTGQDIYIRTDVGGAFRWDESAVQWESISDTIVPTTTPASRNYMRVASIAVDPRNRDNLYLAVGSPGSASRGIFASRDRGATWTAIETAIAMDGNGAYRALGERLAVDPNNSDILWFGSTEDGLQRGLRSGDAWAWTQIPATSVPFGQTSGRGKAGVTFVACDFNGGSTIIYAGVYDSVGATGGIYRSTNGGSTWDKISGDTITRPGGGQVARDGTLYAAAHGVVVKFPRRGPLTVITPEKDVAYRAVATDPNDAAGRTLYVAEGDGRSQFNKIYRSTDAGATWVTQNRNLNADRTIPRTEPDGTPAITGYWFGNITSLLVRPTDPDDLWACDFFGVARTRHASRLGATAPDAQPVWHMLQKNQEETVVEAVRNAFAGPRLITAVADVGGFRYNDLTRRPLGDAGNGFSNPSQANTTSLDFSEGYPDIWVRAWSDNSGPAGGSGGISIDGGVTWTVFGQIARHTVTSGPAGWEEWDLTTYLANQQARGATTVTLVLASQTATDTSRAVLSFDSRESNDSARRPRLLFNTDASLAPLADATVLGSHPAGAHGSNPTLDLAHAWGVEANERQIYLKFDLPASPPITSAHLRLHRLTGSAGIEYPVGVYACADTAWAEETITWAKRPMPYASRVGMPNRVHRYRAAAGLDLAGGRAAISAINPDLLVWMPFGGSTTPHHSRDRGVTWEPVSGLPANVNRLLGKSNPSYNMIQLASDRVDGRFYIAHFSASNGAHRIHRSEDGGGTWHAVGEIPHTGGGYSHYRNQIVAAPGAAGHVWVSDDGVRGTEHGGLWKSTDGGETWSGRLSNITAVRQVAFGKAAAGSPAAYSVFFNGYLNGVKGVYRSDNYGETWTSLPALPTNADIESLAGDRQVHGGVFIGTHGRGVFHHSP